jgi:hypothetical protein
VANEVANREGNQHGNNRLRTDNPPRFNDPVAHRTLNPIRRLLNAICDCLRCVADGVVDAAWNRVAYVTILPRRPKPWHGVATLQINCAAAATPAGWLD